MALVVRSFKAVSVKLAIKTATRTGMAGWAGRFHQQYQRILIAIHHDFLDIEDVTRTLPLHPQPATGPRMKVGLSSLTSFIQRFLVHVSHHQYIIAGRIDSNGGEQSLRVKTRQEFRAEFAFSCIRVGHNLMLSLPKGRHFQPPG